MLALRIIAVGDKMPAWVDLGVGEYARRIRGRMKLELIQIAAEKRTRHAAPDKIIAAEEQKIRRQSRAHYCVGLDRAGETLTSEALSACMREWLQLGMPVALIIGGREGLSRQMLADCDAVWSLSALTLAHPLARLVLAEQLYRGFAILENQPYHR